MKKADRLQPPKYFPSALTKREWGFILPLLLLILLLVPLHNYNDFVITTRQGINFWNILFSGRFFYFYKDNVLVSGNPFFPVEQGCYYSIFVYLVFAVWNIPLALLMRFTNVDVMNSVVCLAYAKILMVCATFLAARLVGEILRDLGQDPRDQKLGMYLLLSNGLVVSCVYLIGGYDIFSVVLQLFGIRALLRKKDWQFVGWFALAGCFKFFALLTFLPLLILRFKKVFQILLRVALVLAVQVLISLPFTLIGGGSGGEGFAKQMLFRMIEQSSLNGQLFVVGYMLLVIRGYCRETNSEEIIWNAAIANVLFFGLLDGYPYWCVLIAPYLILLLMTNRQAFEILLLLETVFSGAKILQNMTNYGWCYRTARFGILGRIRSIQEWSFIYLERKLQAAAPLQIVPCAILASAMAIAWITLPGKKKRAISSNHSLEFLCGLRFTAIAFVCLLPALLYILDIFIR